MNIVKLVSKNGNVIEVTKEHSEILLGAKQEWELYKGDKIEEIKEEVPVAKSEDVVQKSKKKTKKKAKKKVAKK